jgi:hypothetical protein
MFSAFFIFYNGKDGIVCTRANDIFHVVCGVFTKISGTIGFSS